MNKRISIVMIFALIFVFVGCANMQKAPTSKDKLAYVYQIFNSQYEDYLSMAKKPNLTEAQKKVLRAKKPILETLANLIPIYDSQVSAGQPSASQEQQIYDLLNQLQVMVPTE